MTDQRGILHGVRVLDLSRMLSGPYCTMLLADHGAEVIKIEGPEGDTSRGNGPWREDDPGRDWSGYFVSLNRSKASVQLDLKSTAGRSAFRMLASSAHLIVENFRPGVMDRLGLGYEALAEANPALVYGAIRGFGDPRTGESPYADWPSYDVVAQAMGGLIAITGPDAETPTKVGPGIGDIFSGSLLAFGLMAALRSAEATGRGQFVDIAMYDAMVSLCERAAYLYDHTGVAPGPEGNGHPLLAPFGLFPASDGMVALGIVDDAFWRILTEAMGRPELGTDPRYVDRSGRAALREEVNAFVSDWTSRHSKAELSALLGGRIPFGPMNTAADIAADPHTHARGVLAEVPHQDPDARPWTVAANPVRFAASAMPELRSPPRLGADTDRYLAEVPPLPMTDADKRMLRSSFGSFATGVTIITARQEDGTPRGFTANSFTSVSLDPPLLLVCLGKGAHSLPVFSAAEHFAVNILSEAQKDAAQLFASRGPDKFTQADWEPGTGGAPILSGVLASLVCQRERLIDAGDHVILLGRVIDHRAHHAKPLCFFRGSYMPVMLDDDLVSAASEVGRVAVGALIARGPQLLMAVDTDGGLSVPKAPDTAQSREGLETMLRKTGLQVEMGLLYAVYHDTATGKHIIYYRGAAEGHDPNGMKFMHHASIPLEKITAAPERSMIRRYVEELQQGSFGIYAGDEERGIVHRVATHEPSRT